MRKCDYCGNEATSQKIWEQVNMCEGCSKEIEVGITSPLHYYYAIVGEHGELKAPRLFHSEIQAKHHIAVILRKNDYEKFFIKEVFV